MLAACCALALGLGLLWQPNANTNNHTDSMLYGTGSLQTELAGGDMEMLPENFGLPEDLTLSKRSRDVFAQYSDRISQTITKADLIGLTEEEIFFNDRWETVIFRGTVLEIRNITLDFRGDTTNYRALASIQVDKVFRGELEVGRSITVLLPCPIATDMKVEDTGVISQLDVGMEGIFMPILYDEDSIWSQNGAVLYLTDLADYGLADGMRYAFLQTEQGLVYASWSFPGLGAPETLEDIEAYVQKMLEAGK